MEIDKTKTCKYCVVSKIIGRPAKINRNYLSKTTNQNETTRKPLLCKNCNITNLFLTTKLQRILNRQSLTVVTNCYTVSRCKEDNYSLQAYRKKNIYTGLWRFFTFAILSIVMLQISCLKNVIPTMIFGIQCFVRTLSHWFN